MTRILMCLILLSFSTIKTDEIQRIKDVVNYIDISKRTLVLFDIDNTLLCPSTDLGSDHWYEYTVRQKIATGLDKATAFKQTLPLYFHLNLHLDLVPIEASVADDVACIQSMCDRALCLTARSPVLVDKTVWHLQNYALLFQIPEFQEHTFNFAKPTVYKHGVLSCGGNNKGDVLLAFLDTINYTPEVVIFIDDKQHNLDQVDRALKKRNIECICLRYAACDHKAATMNTERVESQLQTFLIEHPYSEDQYRHYV